MRLNKFISLKRKIKSKDQSLKVEIIIKYFVYAKYSYEMFKEYLEKWVSTDEIGSDHKFEVAILAMYSNGKICLEITREINDEIDDPTLNKLRSLKRSWAERFADFRNDASSHPINKNGNYFSYFASSGNAGPNMRVHLLDKETLKLRKEYKIYPKKDIEHLYEYLEKLAEIYESKWVKI